MLVDVVNESSDSRARAVLKRLTTALGSLGLDVRNLRARVSLACADGAYASGGENARHHGTGVLDAFFAEAGPMLVFANTARLVHTYLRL